MFIGLRSVNVILSALNVFKLSWNVYSRQRYMPFCIKPTFLDTSLESV